MTTQNYLVVQNNVVTNIVLWDGASEWIPPDGSTILTQAETPAMKWQSNFEGTEWSLVEVIGAGDIGFTWDGSVLTTNQPKPIPSTLTTTAANQPTSTGTVTA